MAEEIGKDVFIAPNIGKIPLEKLETVVEGQPEPIKKWFVMVDQSGSTEWVKLIYLPFEYEYAKETGIIINIGAALPGGYCNNPPDNVACIWFMLDGEGVETLPPEIASPALSALKALISPPWWEEYKEVLCIAGGCLLILFILAMIKGR